MKIKLSIVLLILVITCIDAQAQKQVYENNLFSIDLGEGLNRKEKDANTIEYTNPKMRVEVSAVPRYLAPADYLVETTERLLQHAKGDYRMDSVRVNNIYIPRCFANITLPGGEKVILISFALNNELETDTRNRVTYELSFWFTQQDAALAILVNHQVEAMKFKKELKLVGNSDYYFAMKNYGEKQQGRKKTGSFYIYNKPSNTKKLEACKIDFESDKLNIHHTKNDLSFLNTWPDFNRPEFGGSRLYADAFNITVDFEREIQSKEQYGFGFAFIFYRVGEYAADTAKYHSFVVTNTGQLYSKAASKKYDENSMCASCWKTFKKDTPKELFEFDKYNAENVQLTKGVNKLRMVYVSGTYYIFLNEKMVYRQTGIKWDVSYDVSPVAVFYNKGDVKVFSQSEEFLY